MMGMKRARIIYNPTSGREAFRKHLPEVLEVLENAGYETSTHATNAAGDATTEAALAVERRYDLVVAAGGDGTINEVVNGLAEKDTFVQSLELFLLEQPMTSHGHYKSRAILSGQLKSSQRETVFPLI